jgi:hypothetical protein
VSSQIGKNPSGNLNSTANIRWRNLDNKIPFDPVGWKGVEEHLHSDSNFPYLDGCGK